MPSASPHPSSGPSSTPLLPVTDDVFYDLVDSYTCNKDTGGNDLSYANDVVPIYGAIEDWDTSSVSDMCGAFSPNRFSKCNIRTGCTNLNAPGDDITGWDVGSVTRMAFLFEKTDFNQDISSWNVGCYKSQSILFCKFH